MSFVTDLIARLTGNAAVAALVADRVHWPVAPLESESPRLVLRRVSEVEDLGLDGPLGAADTRVQVDAWSDDPAEAEALAEAARTALVENDRGAWGETWILGVHPLGGKDEAELVADGAAEPLYLVSRDYLVAHRVPRL